MKKYIALSICNKDAAAEIIEEKEDEMQTIIKCPYCGSITTVGKTLMISGFVGCERCYWGEDGLLNTVLTLQKNNYDEYARGEFYRRGYQGNTQAVAD